MISVKDAKKLILVGTNKLPEKIVFLKNAIGFASAKNIIAPINFPHFHQSAMDGFGIFFNESNNINNYKIIGEAQAGNIKIVTKVKKGEAIRIFTGAQIPAGVNTVIQQEWTEQKDKYLFIQENFNIKKGMNIRLQGSQTKKGDRVVQKGNTISPACASHLASMGIDKLSVMNKPKIYILNTGKELVTSGNTLKGSQIYESNAIGLLFALQKMNIYPIKTEIVDDNKNLLIKKVKSILQKADMLIITGGVSVGDYDFVKEALVENDVKTIFHNIKQKPGKPLYFGTKKNKIVFGLPGNPASVLTCFYQYVYPCIKKMMGFANTDLIQLQLPLLNKYEKKEGFTHFLKAKLHTHSVEILSDQESYKMNTYAIADAIIEIEDSKILVNKNELVKVFLLPT